MNYRIASLLAEEAANSAGTKTIDINLANPISRISVCFKGLNSSNDPTAHPAKMVSKLEVVDGSDVLYSLSGVESQALSYFNQGWLPHNVLNYQDNIYCIATYELSFGRYLFDPLLALDPRKFNNPQLKITHNCASGGSAPDAGVLAVFADVFDEKEVSPTGLLMAKEQYSYTLVASANEHIDLATDYPYRGLMLKSLTAGKAPYEQFHDIKLSEDGGKRTVINNENTSYLLKLLKAHPRITELVMTKDLDSATPVFCTPTYETAIADAGLDAADVAVFTAQSYGGSFNATGTSDARCQFIVSGQNPHGAMIIPFGNNKEIADWFDVSKIGSLRLTVTGGSGASGTCEVVSEQLRSY